MRKGSIQGVGGAGAIGVALCSVAFILFITFHTLTDPNIDGPSVSLILADYALALAGLFGLAVVPALSRRVIFSSPGVVRWVSMIAQVGFGLLAVMSFWQAEYETNFSIEASRVPVTTYEGAQAVNDRSQPFSLVIQEITSRMPFGWLESAGVGLWIFIVSWFARSNGFLSPVLAQIGLSAGASALLVSLGASLQLVTFQLFGLLNFMVLYPVWFGWTGLTLLQADRKQHTLSPVMVRPEGSASRGRWTSPFQRRTEHLPRVKEMKPLQTPVAP